MKISLQHLAFVLFLKLQFFWKTLNFSEVKTTNTHLEYKFPIGLMKVQSQKYPTSTKIIKCLQSLFKVPWLKWTAFVINSYDTILIKVSHRPANLWKEHSFKNQLSLKQCRIIRDFTTFLGSQLKRHNLIQWHV